MKNSIEKINVISNDLSILREELLVLQGTLKETLMINDSLIDSALFTDLLNHIEIFRDLKIPEVINILSTDLM